MSAAALFSTLVALHGGAPPVLPLPLAAVERAVLLAVRRDQQVVAAALWSDRLPRGAHAVVAGPAFASLAASTAARRRAHLRIRLVDSSTRIVALRVARNGRRAVVTVWWSQRLEAVRNSGRPDHAIGLVEEAALSLHWLAHAGRFVVWSAELV